METKENTVQKMVSSLGNPYEVRVLSDEEAAKMGLSSASEIFTKSIEVSAEFIKDPENNSAIIGNAEYPSSDQDTKVHIKIKDESNMSKVVPGVSQIYLKIHDGPSYRYVIWVYGKGPSDGTRTFSFIDEEPDIYKLGLTDTEGKWHSLYYNSKRPNIKTISWY